MKLKCTLPDGTVKILEHVNEKVLDRIPETWKVEREETTESDRMATLINSFREYRSDL